VVWENRFLFLICGQFWRIRPEMSKRRLHIDYYSNTIELVDLGASGAYAGPGFSGLRFAPAPPAAWLNPSNPLRFAV
jgi:hypothetical protein